MGSGPLWSTSVEIFIFLCHNSELSNFEKRVYLNSKPFILLGIERCYLLAITWIGSGFAKFDKNKVSNIEIKKVREKCSKLLRGEFYDVNHFYVTFRIVGWIDKYWPFRIHRIGILASALALKLGCILGVFRFRFFCSYIHLFWNMEHFVKIVNKLCLIGFWMLLWSGPPGSVLRITCSKRFQKIPR